MGGLEESEGEHSLADDGADVVAVGETGAANLSPDGSLKMTQLLLEGEDELDVFVLLLPVFQPFHRVLLMLLVRYHLNAYLFG